MSPQLLTRTFTSVVTLPFLLLPRSHRPRRPSSSVCSSRILYNYYITITAAAGALVHCIIFGDLAYIAFASHCQQAIVLQAALSGMAATTAPALGSATSWASTLPLPGASTSKSSQRTSVNFAHVHSWPSHNSGGRALVSAEYRRGGGAGDFVAGFLLGGAVFGALGYLLAPQITKSLEDADIGKEDGVAVKRPAQFLDEDEGLEVGSYNIIDSSTNKTRKSLNEKIAQLNAAIDDVSAQVRSEDGYPMSNENNVELNTPA